MIQSFTKEKTKTDLNIYTLTVSVQEIPILGQGKGYKGETQKANPYFRSSKENGVFTIVTLTKIGVW